MADTITISSSSDSVSISSVGTQGPAASADTAWETGTVVLNGSTGQSVTFSGSRSDAEYVVVYEQQSLSASGGFGEKSKGEISTESKTSTGFTVKSADELDGVTVRWAVINY